MSELESRSGDVRPTSVHATTDVGAGGIEPGGGHTYGEADLAVPGIVANIAALLPWVDHDHEDAAPKKPKRARKAKRATKAASPQSKVAAPTSAATTTSTTASTTTASTSTAAPATSTKSAGIPADFAEKLAAMKASAFNAALMVHGKNGKQGDRNSQYEMIHLLESADDALTRKKMKEQFAAQGNGSLTDYLGSHTWSGAHAKDQALELVGDKRDATTNKLAAMSPDARADLEDKAAGWADKILNVTRGTDRDDSENADKIAAILGPRSPEEIEVIRKRVRLQTSGTKSTTVFEEIDRTFTERDESIAMAGLGSDPVKVAQTQLVDAAAEGDPERIHAIAKQLGPESMWKLHASDPLFAGRVIASMPDDRRDELSALMNGKTDVAAGARIAAMLQPVELGDLSAADAMNGTAAKKMKQKEAQDPERLIAELSRSSPAELAAARKAWEEGGNGKSWDDLIAGTFKDADPIVRMRIEAAASGDVVGEKALRLRQGMKTFDQSLIDGALANPDLQSDDPKKRAAAQAERRALEQRLQLHDANEQRTTALLDGKTIAPIQGRSVDEQLSAYYERRREHDTGSGAGGPLGAVRDIAEKDERMARIREKATVDRYAATEMWHEGDAQLSTKVRRTELSGDTTKKAEILEQAKKGTLATHDADYKRKFGSERSMLAGPDLGDAKDVVKVFARMTGDDRPTEEIAAALARENMNAGELRMQHVRETGALADRTREQRIAQQTELRTLSQSGWLAGEEQMRFALGGNRGSDDLHASTIALLQQSSSADVDDREFQRRDTSATKALELQREEKQKSAASVAQALSIAGKIAALLTANPALFVAVDAGFSAARIAAQELIANEAYEASDDIKHMAVDMAVNLATARLASLGKGVEAGTEAAKGVQTVQRVGNATAAMGGAAAHAMIDGDDPGGAVLRAGVGAILPGYFRGKVEGAIQGTGKVATAGRAVLGTATDVVSNVGISGGHLDGATLIDAVGNTVQQGAPHAKKRDPDARRGAPLPDTRHAPDQDSPRRRPPDEDYDVPDNVAADERARKAMERPQSTDDHARRGIEQQSNAAARPLAVAAADTRGAVVNGAETRVSGALGSRASSDGDAPSSVLVAKSQGGESPDSASSREDIPLASRIASRSEAARGGELDSLPASTTPGRDFHHDLAMRQQARANAERANKLRGQEATFREIDELAALATTPKDWDDIRKMEHDARRPVPERYSPHDEIAALQQYERAGGLKHADGTPMTPDEAKAWIAQTRSEFQPSVDEKVAAHHETVDKLTSDLEARIAVRDAVKTKQLAGKAKEAPIDDSGRRIVHIDQAVSLGMGGAGASAAKQRHVDDTERVMTREDRIGIEDSTRPELWGTLDRKPIGQEARAVSYGRDGIRTSDVAEHPTAQVARANELALQVAAQRNDSQLGTIGSKAPVGELQVKQVELPDGRKVLEVGVPVTMEIDGRLQTVVVTTTKGVDIATGMGPARDLTTDKTEATTNRRKQIDSDYAEKLRGDKRLMSGEQALAKDPSHFDGKRVLGIGGGPTSVWAGEHAQRGGAASVEVVGQMPRPAPGTELAKKLDDVEAKIRTLAMSGQEVPPALTEAHHTLVDEHVRSQEQKLNQLDRELQGELSAYDREQKLAERGRILNNIDPFSGARLDPNHAMLNSDKIRFGQADVMFMKPTPDGATEVIFTDGTRTIVDHVIPSIGQDSSAEGGVDAMLKGFAALPLEVKLLPVIAEGRVVGLESDPPGISISGAALTGTTGLSMPATLMTRIPEGMRDAVVTSIVDHANRETVSDDSRGVVPGIENVGDSPQLMQEALTATSELREAERARFLQNHTTERKKSYAGTPRYSDRELRIMSRPGTARGGR